MGGPIKSGWYILKDKAPVPCAGLHAWARWACGNDRHVGYDEIEGVAVSTIFLGWDHRNRTLFPDLPPLLFETMIIGGKHNGYQMRTCTWHEAEAEHTKAWDLVAGVHA